MSIIRLITDQNLNPLSKVEKIGDFILTPPHLLWGKKFVYFPTRKINIEVAQDSVSIQKATRIAGFWYKTALKIMLLPLIALLPLGLLIKSFSLAQASTRHAYSIPVEKLTSDNLSKEVYLDIAKNPLRYFYYEPGFFEPSYHTFATLDLRECACSAFDRLFLPHRTQLEERLVQDLMPLVEKNQPPRIISLGCGKLLSEFRFVGLLLAKGHREIDLDLIDPTKDSAPEFKNLVEFYKRLGLMVRLKWYSGVDAYEKEHKEANVDALYAMDYDDMASEEGAAAHAFIKAREHLAAKAKTYLGFSGAIVISKDNQYEFLNKFGMIQKFINILDTELSNFNKPMVRIAIPRQAPRSLEFLIAVTEWAKKRKISHLEFTYLDAEGSITPQAREEKNNALNDWVKSCVSDSLQITEKEGSLQNNYFDLLGPRFFLPDNEPYSNADLKKAIAPGGAVLTFTDLSPLKLTVLSHSSLRTLKMK